MSIERAPLWHRSLNGHFRTVETAIPCDWWHDNSSQWGEGTVTAILRFLFAFMLLILGNAYGDDQKAASTKYLRNAMRAEVVGVWSIEPNPGMGYKFRFVAITEDGRIGWLYSNNELTTVSQAAILDSISKNEIENAVAVGWDRYEVIDGRMTILSSDRHTEQYFLVQVFVDPSVKEQLGSSWMAGAPGELRLDQVYKSPPSSAYIDAFTAPHMAAPPPPMHLHRIKDM